MLRTSWGGDARYPEIGWSRFSSGDIHFAKDEDHDEALVTSWIEQTSQMPH